MNTEKTVAVPTEEEVNTFFQGLPGLKRQHIRPLTPGVRAEAGSVEAFVLQSPPPSDGDPDNLAEIGKEEPVVVAFADGVSPQNRKAVLLSVKFAEAYARAEDDGDKDRIKWLNDYSQAMFIGGWGRLGGESFSEYSTQDVSLTMDAVVIDLISAIAGPNKAAVLQLLSLTLDKLQQDEGLMQLFERNSQKGLESSFRIMPCLESRTGIPVTYLLAMEVRFSQETGGAIFWKWSVSRLHIRQMVEGLNFDIDHHDRYKHKIYEYLDSEVDDFFAGLKKG